MKTKKKLIISLFIFLVCNKVVAQKDNDSIHYPKVMELIFRADYYRFNKPDSFLPVAQDAIQLARKYNYKKGEASALLTIGEYHRVSGNYPQALENLFNALQLSKEISDSSLVGSSLTFIGNCYIALEDYKTALKYLFESYYINKELPADNLTAFSLSNIGIAYEGMRNLDSAMYYQQMAWSIGKPLDAAPGKAFTLTRIGMLHGHLQNYDSAFFYYRHGLQYAKDVLNAGRIYGGMSDIFLKTNQIDSAKFYARLSFSYGQRSLQKQIMLNASNLLSKVFLQNQIPDSVIKYQQLIISLTDSLFGPQQFHKLQLVAFNEQAKASEAELKRNAVEKEQIAYKNRTRSIALLVILFIFVLTGIFLFRDNRRKKLANHLLTNQKIATEKTLQELQATQKQLIQSEKMASLGELTAGIAHEIQNPLNFVNNFSDVNTELIEELKAELTTGNMQEAMVIADGIKENEQKISHHGKRADAIVKGMLQHSRNNNGQKEPTDINALADEYLRLAYHGMRAKDKAFNATLKTDFDQSIGMISIIPQDIGRVILNLITNAFYAINEKNASTRSARINHYEPTVSISTKKINDKVEIKVTDNGNGIPQKVLNKIFQPFFTTKPTGQGTGLGLSLSYDIVKAHGGELKVVTREGGDTEFIISLPEK